MRLQYVYDTSPDCLAFWTTFSYRYCYLLDAAMKADKDGCITKQLPLILDCQREISGGALPVFGEPAKFATIERTTGSNLQRFTVGGISKLGTQCRVVASPQD